MGTAMICGLVDVEFRKLVKGLHKGENALDKFYNANVNLATGSQAMNVFRPEPAVKRQTHLESMPEYICWDKVNVKGEISIQQFVEQLEKEYGMQVQRVFPAGSVKVALYDSQDKAKLDWNIDVAEDEKVTIEPAAVYTQWPQLRMAVQMLPKLPAGAGRNNFLNQIRTAQKSLQGVKDTFMSRFLGPVSDSYLSMARPSDEEADKQKYFDAVFTKRSYIVLQIHAVNSQGEDIDFPNIQYTFRGQKRSTPE